MPSDAADTHWVKSAGPAIELLDASRSFNGRPALHSLNLTIEPGEVFGLLGPNGSGKTTTLRILATLIRPTSGRARVLGFDVVDDAMEIRRRVGVMPEKPSLYDRLTVRDNLAFWADAHGIADPARAISEALAFVGLSDRADDRPGQLSKGWRQRVALARAIVHRPPILLLDEPSSGLDPSAAAAMERMVRELVAGGATVLMNSHRLAEAERLCDRVAILRHGHLLELGTPHQLRARLLGNMVKVELAQPADIPARRAVEATPGIEDLRWLPGGFSCRLPEADRDTPPLIAGLVHAGAAILSVIQAGDLEEAYLELMTRTAEAAELEAAA